MPFINKNIIIRSSIFRPIYGLIVWFFFFICFLLGWIGSLPVISPFLEIGQLVTFLYFFIIILLFPYLSYFEKSIYNAYIRRSNRYKNKIWV